MLSEIAGLSANSVFFYFLQHHPDFTRWGRHAQDDTVDRGPQPLTWFCPPVELVYRGVAFDTVSRAGLWKIMAKYGCPDKFIALVCQFHDGMLVRVTDDGDSSEPIVVTNGVKHTLQHHVFNHAVGGLQRC